MRYHVFQTDHTGRGYQRTVRGFTSKEVAQAYADILKKHRKVTALSSPVFYVVEKDAS